MSEEKVGIITFCLIIIICIFAGVAATTETTTYKQGEVAVELIAECEAPLLRTEKCVIKAVKEEKMTDKVIMPKSLTAENGARQLLVGEFYEEIEGECLDHGDTCYDENCGDCGGTGNFIVKVPIQWTTIKSIYTKAVQGLGINYEEIK